MIRLAAAVLAVTALAGASTAAAASATAAAPPAAAVPEPPMVLPARGPVAAASGAAVRAPAAGPLTASAQAVRAAGPATWLVGGRPVPAAARIARRHGATRVAPRAWVVPRAGARALAADFRRRGLLAYAEPDRIAVRAQTPAPDPLSPLATWRDAIVAPGLVPPPVTPSTPLLALIDSAIDPTHPELAGGNVRTLGTRPPTVFHGTATAAIAAAPANGVGFVGVWPGMPVLNLPLPDRIRCSDSARRIRRAVREGATVINMSYGSPSPCFAEYEALQEATARGIALVAAAGNEFESGNAPQYPGALPHVLTVAAVDAAFRSSLFSNANPAVDVAAPGEGVLTAVPVALDRDGTADGYASVAGTSFASPMAAAVVTWVRAVRPELTVDQAVQVVRLSAGDIDREGYDRNTGFGIVRLAAALQARPPIRDRFEPNEDVRWIDRRQRPLNRARRPAAVTALLDRHEDPRDVYRVVVPARRRLSVSVRPRFGDADLIVHDGSAETVRSLRGRLGASLRDGTRTDRVTILNRASRVRSAWVTVEIDDGARTLDSSYTLRVAPR